MNTRKAMLDTKGLSAPRNDFPRALVLLAVGVPLLLVLLAASPLGADFLYVMAGIPLLLLVWAAAALWALVLSIRFAMRKRWAFSCTSAVLPIAVSIAILNMFSFVRYCNYLGDVLHFIVARPYYEHVIAELPRNAGPRLAVFNWGGMVWASHGLVYDESDEVALPPGKQSAAWLANPGLGELSCKGFGVQPLWSHYYLASFPC
jgi:hypothetical protein